MKIPNYVHEKLVNGDGDITSAWQYWFDSLIQGLQAALSDQGYLLPTLTTAQIAELDPAKSINTLFINSTTNQLIVNLNGVFKTVQTI